MWTLAAAFLAIALNPLVERLEPRMGRRPAATVVVLGFVIGFIAVIAAFVAPFVTQVDALSKGLPQAITDAQHNSTLQRLDHRFHLANQAKAHLDSLPHIVFGTAGTVLGGAVAVSTVFFLTLLLLFELPSIARVGLQQIPPRHRPRVVAATQHMNRTIGGYVAGNLFISLICGVVTTVSLYLLGVPYSLALGVFMAVFDLIPLDDDYHRQAPKTDPRYYYRPWKTILVRTVADGGESFYVQGDHRQTVPAIWKAATS